MSQFEGCVFAAIGTVVIFVAAIIITTTVTNLNQRSRKDRYEK